MATASKKECATSYGIDGLTELQAQKLMSVLNAINDDDLDAIFWAFANLGVESELFDLKAAGKLVMNATVVKA